MTRGRYTHNRILLDPIDKTLRWLGANVWSEYPTGPGRGAGFIDLFAIVAGLRIAVEAELSPRRVAWDLRKALAVNADLLLIVTPNRRVADRAKRHLTGHDDVLRPECPAVWILPLGVALSRLTKIGQFKIRSNVARSSSQQDVRRKKMEDSS